MKNKKLLFSKAKKSAILLMVFVLFLVSVLGCLKLRKSQEALASFYQKRAEAERKTNPSLALLDYSKALSLAPTNLEIHFSLGQAYQDWGNLQEAEKQYQLILFQSQLTSSQNNPSLSKLLKEVYFNLGNLYLSEKKYSQALEVLKKGLEYSQEGRFYTQIGLCYLNLKDIKKAEEAFKIAKREDKKAFYYLGLVTLTTNPQESQNYFAQADFEKDEAFQKQIQMAQQGAKSLSQTTNQTYQKLLLAEIFLKNNFLGLAEEFVQEVLKKEANLRDAWLFLGQIKFLQNDFEEALKNFRKAKTLDPVFAKTYFWLGQTYQQLGWNNLAQTNLQKAIDLGFKKED